MQCRRALAAAVFGALMKNSTRCATMGPSGVNPGVKTSDPTYEDERWLEAELEDKDKNKTPEERYAAEQERKALAKMISQMRAETNKALEQHKMEVNAAHAREVASLKEQLKTVQTRLDTIQGKKP